LLTVALLIRIYQYDLEDGERGYFLRPNPKERSSFVNPIPTIVSEKFKPEHISEIWIGSRCNKQKAEDEIKKLLEKNGYNVDDISIQCSEIPYGG